MPRPAVDDVDDLLDELNGLLDEPADKRKGATAPVPAPRASAAAPRAAPQQQTGASAKCAVGPLDDLDALLADVEGPDDAQPPQRKSAPPPRPQPATIAAPAVSSEHATSYRCSKCDFRVLRFDEQRWAPDADYMFLRNYMPDVAKLQTKLLPADSQCAQACQCTAVTIELGSSHGVSHWFLAMR